MSEHTAAQHTPQYTYEVTLVVAGLDPGDDEQMDAVFGLTQDVVVGNHVGREGRELAEVGVCEEISSLREAARAASSYLEILRIAVEGVDLVSVVIDCEEVAGGEGLEEAVERATARLDGSTGAKVAVLSGMDDEELEELGGTGRAEGQPGQ